jgi:hypothetical protein
MLSLAAAAHVVAAGRPSVAVPMSPAVTTFAPTCPGPRYSLRERLLGPLASGPADRLGRFPVVCCHG